MAVIIYTEIKIFPSILMFFFFGRINLKSHFSKYTVYLFNAMIKWDDFDPDQMTLTFLCCDICRDKKNLDKEMNSASHSHGKSTIATIFAIENLATNKLHVICGCFSFVEYFFFVHCECRMFHFCFVVFLQNSRLFRMLFHLFPYYFFNCWNFFLWFLKFIWTI